MELFTSLGIDPERLSHRVDFLLSRANMRSYAEQERYAPGQIRMAASRRDEIDVIEQARVATLFRDAGFIQLILGEYDAGRISLARAGSHFVNIGLPVGYILLTVAATGTPFRESKGNVDFPSRERYEAREMWTELSIRDDIAKWVLPELSGHEESEREVRRPLLQKAVLSPYQLLYLYQVIRIQNDPYEMAKQVRERLADYPNATVGIVETPLRNYLNLFDDIIDGTLSAQGREVLNSLVSRRRESLEIARADEYHWVRMLRPDSVVDLDVLTLCLAGAETGIDARAAIEATMHDYPGAVSLPFEIAQGLRRR